MSPYPIYEIEKAVPEIRRIHTRRVVGISETVEAIRIRYAAILPDRPRPAAATLRHVVVRLNGIGTAAIVAGATPHTLPVEGCRGGIADSRVGALVWWVIRQPTDAAGRWLNGVVCFERGQIEFVVLAVNPAA